VEDKAEKDLFVCCIVIPQSAERRMRKYWRVSHGGPVRESVVIYIDNKMIWDW